MNKYLLLTSPDTFVPIAAIFTRLKSNKLEKYLEKHNFLRLERVCSKSIFERYRSQMSLIFENVTF